MVQVKDVANMKCSPKLHAITRSKVYLYFAKEIKVVKKFILGITLFIGGIIGFVGWVIACVTKVQPGSKSVVLASMRGSDNVITALFVVMVLVGLLIAIIESKKE